MADPEDVKALKAGDNDLVHRDLRGENFSNSDFSGRDFSEAHIEKSNFDGCKLSGSIFSKSKSVQATFKDANLSNVVFSGSSIVQVSFKDANLEGVDFSRSHFSKCDFSNCNLSEANFKDAAINEGCNFDDCIVSAKTLFDGASVFRPMSRLPAFRFYKVERGVLVRLMDDEISEEPNIEDKSTFESTPTEAVGSNEHLRDEVLKKIDALEEQLAGLYEPDSEGPMHGGIGHNNPPKVFPLKRNDISVVLGSAREVAKVENTDKSSIEPVRSKIAVVSVTILKWIANKCEVAATEFSKQLGKTLASKSFIVGVSVWLEYSEGLRELSNLLQKLLQ